jgi:hypothetical protein
MFLSPRYFSGYWENFLHKDLVEALAYASETAYQPAAKISTTGQIFCRFLRKCTTNACPMSNN